MVAIEPSKQTAIENDGAHQTLVLGATVILGLGAILTAWGSYQSSTWGGRGSWELTNSVLATTESVDAFQSADTTRALDQIVMIELLTSGVCSDDDGRAACAQLTETLSNEGKEELGAWLSGDRASVFDANRRYRRGGDELIAASEQYFEKAQRATSISADYTQATTFVALSLFFAGTSLVLSRRRIRSILLAMAALCVAGPLAVMVTLPWG